MKPLPRNAENILSQLERSATDELSYLESVGAEYFSTAQLIRLKGQWEVKNRLFDQVQRLLLRIVAVSPLWIGAWLLFSFLQWTYVALLCLALFPLSFVVFGFGLYWMRCFFKNRGHLDTVGDMIDAELRKRRQDF